MKLCPSEQNLVRNILKSKCLPHVTSEHAQMVISWDAEAVST